MDNTAYDYISTSTKTYRDYNKKTLLKFSMVMSAKTDACVLIKTESSGYMGHPPNEA